MRPKSNPVTRTLSRAYGLGTRVRKLIYDSGLIKAVRIDRPVISVGNIVAGGAGKTPLTIMLVELLQARGLKVCVLSRGYGAQEPPIDRPRIVCDGQDILLDAARSGDEPQMIAQRTSACVVVYPDRVEAAQLALDALQPDVFIMDDGFQHWRLQRDLNILVMDAAAPLGNGELLPAGPLRESSEAIEKAHLIAVNHGPRLRDEISDKFEEWGPSIQVVMRPEKFVRLASDHSENLNLIKDKSVAVISAIARPERFVETVKALGGRIVFQQAYRDHHNISCGEFSSNHQTAKAAGAEIVLITEKDAARMQTSVVGAPPVFALAMNMEIVEGAYRLEAALDRLLGVATGVSTE